MTIESAFAFAVGMFLLALVPGPGLATIISRTIGSGLKAGFAVTAGLCIGDFIFLGLAMIGLSTIANAFGPAFQVVKYIGAAYLIWIGFQMFRAARKPIEVKPVSVSHPLKETALGLFVTLGNPKPILFYSALLPTFVDMTKVGFADYLILSATVVIVSCVVYGGYMLLADRSRRFLASTTAAKRLNQITGITLVGAGVAVATR